MDIELKQASSAAMMEYNKKGKCAELERFEREKVMQIFDLSKKNLLCRQNNLTVLYVAL
jgi:hypothetical protein